MSVISTIILVLVLLCIVWFIQQNLFLAARKFYPFFALGLLIATVYWLMYPREATTTFIGAGDYMEYVVNSTLSAMCQHGADFTCPLVNR